MAEQVDVVVLGLGVGGEEVGGRLAEAGLAVVGIENGLVGGECPYWGCVPSKMMIRAANLLAEARRVDGMAGHADVSPDWAPVADRIRDEATDDWNDQVAVDRFTGKGGRFVRGRGRLAGSGTVEVDGERYETRRGVVLATGTVPVIPPIDGLADAPYWTNRDAIEAKTLPESLLVLGGGAIGVELAQAYARFGVAVTVVEAMDRLLPTEEPESSAWSSPYSRPTASPCTPAPAPPRSATIVTSSPSPPAASCAQSAFWSPSGAARSSVRSVDTVGLDPSAPAVTVDERMRAGDRLWAIGDITGHGAFTHMAMYQAGIAIRDILGEDGPPADYRAVPRVTFTDPEIGAVGLTEAQARQAGMRVTIGLTQIPSSARGWIHKTGNEGIVKLVADADRGVLVGATSAGPTGGEVLAGLAVAVHAQVPVDTLRHMIYAYPTFHRGIEDALRQLS